MRKTSAIVWPHEAPTPSFWSILRSVVFPRDKQGRIRRSKLGGLLRKNLVNIIQTYVLGKTDPYPSVREEAMVLSNSERSKDLANKYHFVETVAAMGGYRTPRQILARPGDEPTPILATISSWASPKIYCKPVNGDNARGIQMVSPREIPQIIHSLREEYVLQEAMPFTRELRYAISWGTDGLVRRLCFEKIRPVLVGDGKTALWQLIISNSQMTIRSKLVSLVRQGKKLWRVIPPGEQYETTGVANPPRGSFERVITDPETVKHIDGFMLQFISDLEQFTQAGPLRLLCFDIGIIGSPTLKLEKDSVVFIECQMPFSALVYFWQHPHGLASLLYFYSSTF